VGVLSGQEHSPHRGPNRRGPVQAGYRHDKIDEWHKTAARYRSEPETGEGQDQLSERAKHAEEERDLAAAKYHHFELASAAFQIGIVLASATIITGIVVLAWASGVLALAGIAITALGIFMPHLLHLP
jgi:hypothetical protein